MKSWQTYYRPQTLDELHLTSVKQQIKQLTDTAALPQVLLFAGPKGTGKTSTARIIGAMLNSKINEKAVDKIYLQKKGTDLKQKLANPDLKNPEVQKIFQGDSYLVVELDAASHRGIDDVRALSEQIYLPPTMGKVRVYILDEAHMFTTEAFNALLKTLEEPPAHAFFILATTEAHKIPATVVSRCQVINFHRASETELLAAFERILKAEKIKASTEALAQIASLADGSFRDGVKLLQMVATIGEITLESVNQTLLGGQQQLCENLTSLILQKDSQQLVAFFADLRVQGVDEKFFLKNFTNYLYEALLANIKKTSQPQLSLAQAQFLLNQIVDLKPNNLIPHLSLELSLLNIFTQAKSKR